MTCIDALLALGADVEATLKPRDVTPLLLAVKRNRGDCVKALVERHGADVNACSCSTSQSQAFTSALT